MTFSICIPLYNKFFALERLLDSIQTTLDEQGIEDFEIVVANNASTDATPPEIDSLIQKYRNAKVFHIARTISLPENWVLALNYAEGDIIKLQLADDEFGTPDLRQIQQALEEKDTNYVILETDVIFSEDIAESERADLMKYFDKVNRFRSTIHISSEKERLESLLRERILEGNNLFGDANAVFFRKSCMDLIKKPIRSGDAVAKSWPDLELYFRLFLGTTGRFLNAGRVKFHINKTSTCVSANQNPAYFRQIYSRLAYFFLFDFLLDSNYADIRSRIPFKARLRLALSACKPALRFLLRPQG